tara:strand:- start:1 stop:255 length:255 start_codon:yes stop_codon:yes gene_type:complete
LNFPLVRVPMTLLNIWSVGHFVQWTIIGRYFLENRYLFWILSIGWEVIELGLPFEFAVESWENKLSDVIVNAIGFHFGNKLRKK